MKRRTTADSRKVIVLIFGACLTAVAGAAGAQSAFVKVGPETLYDAGERCAVPFWSVTDLNGDGRPDIVLGNTPMSNFTANAVPGELMMWIANPDGGYAERARELFSGGVLRAYSFPQVRVADFNGDGIPDVFVPDPGVDTYVNGVPVGPWLGATPKLALSNGAGKWVDASDRLAALKPTFAHSATVADVDGDGKPDVFVANTAVAPSYLLMNAGQGNFVFTQATLPAEIADWDSRPVLSVDGNTNRRSTRSYTSALFVDVDNDGDPDLIVMPQNSTPTGFLALNDGHGNFAARPPIAMPPGLWGSGYGTDRLNPDGSRTISSTRGTVGLDMRAVDLNGDGYLDLVVIETVVDPNPADYTQYRGGRIQILINQQGRGFADETDARGAPGYSASSNYDAYHGTLSVFDINADGYPDLIVARPWTESHVFLNDGSGRFARASAIDGLPLDGVLVPVSGGDGKDIRVVRIKVEYYTNGSSSACKLRAQTYGRSGSPIANHQGLWWNAPAGSESGWGINLAHQGDVIFATWFTYDGTGKALWLSMTANKTEDGRYTGTLYQTRGPAFSAVPFNPAAVSATAVGSGTLTFPNPASGSFTYTVDGIRQTKAVTRQVFGPLPTCTFGAQPNLALATNYQDLWWAAPAGFESGWGVNFTHQGDTIFATWFTYDVDGTPLWLSATTPKTGPGVYTGTLYRTTGPAFYAVPFIPANVGLTPVGTLTLSFASGNNATFAYTVNGVTQSKPIMRQVFRDPGTVCQ